MLKIYGADLSGPANKVRFLANALNLEYEYVRVKIREGEHRKEEYLRINPIGKVPAIDDDGFHLFESNAICKYLCNKNNSNLYPKNLQQRGVVDAWLDFGSIHIGAAINRVVFNRVFTKFIDVPVDEQSLKDGISFLERFLPVADNQLSKSQYLAGNELTLADFNLLSVLDPCEVSEVDLAPYPNITRWRNVLRQQDFYTKCHKDYGDALQQMAAQMK